MIAGAIHAANLAVDTGVGETLRGLRRKQQMIKPKPRIARPSIAHVVPERVHWRLRIEHADRIEPACIEDAPEQRPAFGLHQCIVRV